jgi:hypothetical protein
MIWNEIVGASIMLIGILMGWTIAETSKRERDKKDGNGS